MILRACMYISWISICIEGLPLGARKYLMKPSVLKNIGGFLLKASEHKAL
jgi:hypothetical protein